MIRLRSVTAPPLEIESCQAFAWLALDYQQLFVSSELKACWAPRLVSRRQLVFLSRVLELSAEVKQGEYCLEVYPEKTPQEKAFSVSFA